MLHLLLAMTAAPENVANVTEDLARLGAAIADHISDQTATPHSVKSVEPLAGGACQDNFKVTVESQNAQKTYVLRSDARSSLLGSIPRRIEGAIVNAAVANEVKTPPALWPIEDLLRPSASAYFMPWVAGVAIGRKVVASPNLAEARDFLPSILAIELAKIHAISPETRPNLFPETAPLDAPAERAVADLRSYIAELPSVRPAIAAILRWLEANQPEPERSVLNHGDFRTGNFMVTRNGLEAILDWEFAHWGSRCEDLAWICVRDWRFGALSKPVGGFGDRHEFLTAYEAAAKTTVDPKSLWWWEVMGNARWAVGAVQQTMRYLSGNERDLEYLAIGRRAVEMEWEALRLIRTGQPKWRM